jgi:inorganic pyrophosphatase
MDIRTVGLHPDFPCTVWAVVEQPAAEPYRLQYEPEAYRFTRTELRSLTHMRGFVGAYGWIGGLGTPPDRHCDLILMTERPLAAGEVVLARIAGIFYRRDGDHKVVAVDVEAPYGTPGADILTLPAPVTGSLFRLYPEVGEGEGWHGREEACAYLCRWTANR